MGITRIAAIVSVILLATYFIVPMFEVSADEGKSGPQGCLKIKSPGKNAKCPKPPPPNTPITAMENL